jgi:hypothetical protein
MGRRHSLVPRGGEGTAWQGLFPVATDWGLTRLWSGFRVGNALAPTGGGLTTG